MDEVAGAGDDDEGPRPFDDLHLGQVGEQPIGDRRRWAEPQLLLRVDAGNDACGRVDGDDPAAVDDRHPVGEALRLLHEVGNEQDGDASIADGRDQVPRLAPRLRVEAGGQLVEDRDLRPPHQGEGDGEALLLPSGEVAVLGAALLSQPEVLDEAVRVGWIGVERGEQPDGLGHRHPVGELALLELDSHEGPELVAVLDGIKPEDPDRSRVGSAQAGDRLDRRGLPCAVRPEDAEDLSLFDGEGNAVDGRLGAVALGDVVDFDDVHAVEHRGAPLRHIGRETELGGAVG